MLENQRTEIIKEKIKAKLEERSKLSLELHDGIANDIGALKVSLTNEDVYIENQLFATLDTTTRKFELPLGQEALLSDTVGFIKKLPTHLVASFERTLGEAKESDFLLHVVDVSHQYFRSQIDTVNETLDRLKIKYEENIIVFNKIRD